jgi:dihydroorotase
MNLANTPGATPAEVHAVFELAAQRGVPVFVRVHEQKDSDGFAALTRLIAQAKATGASLHVGHVVASMGAVTPQALAAIDAARAEGLLVTTEVHPSTADAEPAGVQEVWVETALRHPEVLVASDDASSAGTHARVLGVYVRERGVLTLMDALARMSWLPARRLEWCTPAMAHKGRIRAGADADLVVFDPATVIDRATNENSSQASDGIPYVLVSGRFVVRDGALVEGALPGKPLRSRVGLLRSQEQN